MSSSVQFTINGRSYTVVPGQDRDITAATSLAIFLRTKTPLRGTKISCHEGGCGACTVALTYMDPATNQTMTRSVNSCLRPLYSCHGMEITTIEGIGGHGAPYHAIQQRLADASGTQCGYCSPGMVMALYSFLSKNPTATQLEIEQEFDGNLCRCTGYRPILEAFKSFGSDAKEPHCKKEGCKRQGLFTDIEEMVPIHTKTHPEYSHKNPVLPQKKLSKQKTAVVSDSDIDWIDCSTEADICKYLPQFVAQGKKVMLVGGRTSLGIYSGAPGYLPNQQYNVMLNIAPIPSLRGISQGPTGIMVGAMVPISTLIDFLAAVKPWAGAVHLPRAIAHLNRIAGNAIRNAGTVAGNLMIAQQNTFQSDLAIVMMGLGANLIVVSADTGTKTSMDMPTFLASGGSAFATKYIASINIPWATANETFQSYKIAVRQVMSHAIINCAFRVAVDPTTLTVTSQPTIAYGGIFPKQQRLTALETAMVGQKINDPTVFQSLVTQLQGLVASLDPSQGRTEYRKSQAINFFYKWYLSLQPALPSTLSTGMVPWLTRSLTQASQAFQPDPAEYPVSKGMPKLEAIAQTSGEAIYTDDITLPQGCLHAAMVLAPAGNCTFDPKAIDISAAQQMQGFIAFYSSLDADPTANATATAGLGEVFCSGTVLFASQVVGVVIADTAVNAKLCAAAVVVPVTDVKISLLTTQDCVNANSFWPESVWPKPAVVGDVTKGFASSQNVVEGVLVLGGQQHFHLESHVTLAIPTEGDGLSLHSACQGPGLVLRAAATFTGTIMSKVEVTTKRCGGGFGGKIANPTQSAAIAAFAAKKLQMPVSILVDMQDTMRTLGSREDYYIPYKIGFNNDGSIIAIQATVNSNAGCQPNGCGFSAMIFLEVCDNCYKIPNWSVTAPVAKSNIPVSQSTRGPGWISATYVAERFIARVASETKLTLDTVRAKNFYSRGDATIKGNILTYYNMPIIYAQLQESASYAQRQADVAAYNVANKWTKRGIVIQPARFPISFHHGGAPSEFQTHVSVYPDGTVIVQHGGIEIGQGINTKVAQAAALALGCDLGLITVAATNTRALPNIHSVTGGSVTSEMCCDSILACCRRLSKRLAPYRQNNAVPWNQAVGSAFAEGVNLSEQGYGSEPLPADSTVWNYNSYSAIVTEVLVDCLSGQYEVLRADILFDCGISLNPTIDIGQVEGGFLMGQGVFLQEQIARDPTTGLNLTAGTWEYKPPSAYDLPEVFNVTLLRNAPNPRGILGSKATGEPAVALGASVVLAIEEAVSAFRLANGVDTKRWVCPATPLTVDAVQVACGISPSMMSIL